MNSPLDTWLEALGYKDSPGALHLQSDQLPSSHPYHSELYDLLSPEGHIQAKAVFDVDGVPTICFFDDANDSLQAVSDLIRERIWNQNLVSIVLTVQQDNLYAMPSALRDAVPEVLSFNEAYPFGAFSSADIQSGELFNRYPTWFSPEKKVDHTLLKNLSLVVGDLTELGIEKLKAQILMAQLMFIAYLEHRGIVGETYRTSRDVSSLFSLVRDQDHQGILKLLEHLKADFNGDLLGPSSGVDAVWGSLSEPAFSLLNDFLDRVDLDTRQQAFWSYDFRLIPVELLSGIYEIFLLDEKRSVGAYYTPRHLAMLAVDQAFAHSKNILHERVYDGACGSGILLTTAFRRMIAFAEADSGRQLTFAERNQLLKNNIFGSDINESACRVTAFSLYLSVLEHLEPTDIARLTEKGVSKLPHLIGSNIQAGLNGDFFSEQNPHMLNKSFTIFLSNPPWVEPKGKEVLSADTWVSHHHHTIPRRQLCAAFMLRALDCLANEDSRMCFILPVSILAASTSQSFVRDWTRLCEIETIINFGDLRKLLFDQAKQPTLVVVVKPKSKTKTLNRPEIFDYLIPKADISFAFGRLTLHGSDRHQIPTSLLAMDNTVLTTLFWGNAADQALLTKMQLNGSVDDLFDKSIGWTIAKGFHKHDLAVEHPVSSAPLRRSPFLDARKFDVDGPLLNKHVLEAFPDEIDTVANLSKDLIELFAGPRIVFTDGMTSNRELCAGYTDASFSFSSSLGVIKAPPQDEDLLRFLSIYLHSDLVRYALLLTAYQISFERERVTLRNLKDIPFIRPSAHRNPARAHALVKEASSFVKRFRDADLFELTSLRDEQKSYMNDLVYEYFEITLAERSRINEIMNLVLPSIQPSSYEALRTPLQSRARTNEIKFYQSTLLQELEIWRDEMGGVGSFVTEVTLSSDEAYGALGIVKLDIAPKASSSRSLIKSAGDLAVSALIAELRRLELLPSRMRNNLYLMTNFVVRAENSLYLVKPLVSRFWLQGEATRDAERFVRFIQGRNA